MDSVKKMLDNYERGKLYTEVTTALKATNGKEVNSGTVGYSGKFNVKAFLKHKTNNDWRVLHKNTEGDFAKRRANFHLIIALDNSGSYGGNDEATNILFKKLTKIEKEFKDRFHWSLMKFNYHTKVVEKDEDRISYSSGGTSLKFLNSCYDKLHRKTKQGEKELVIILQDGEGSNMTEIETLSKKLDQLIWIVDKEASRCITHRSNMRVTTVENSAMYPTLLEDNIRKELIAWIK